MGPPSPHQSTRPAWCSSNATPANPTRCHALCESGREPLAAYLARFDIVVNCVLQDTAAPLMFVTDSDLAAFSPGSLIIDVSRDTGWAQLGTTHIICGPDVHVGGGIHYYAVDHSPSLLWNSATWEISNPCCHT